ncbi:MAG: TonB-dependent receptor family protein [Thermaurantimonas sp.]
MNSSLLLITIISLNHPISTDPDTTHLNEVTIVGSRIQRITGSGEVLTPTQLQRLNQPDFTRAIRLIPGINVRDEEGFGLRPNIGMRGTSVDRSRKITLMEDAILIAPAPYSDPAAYYFPTFQRIEGIEVLKGNSQIKHGPHTIGGAINMLSAPIPDQFMLKAHASYGSFNTSQLRLTAGDQHGRIAYVFDIGRWGTDGFRRLDNGGSTGFVRNDFLGKIQYQSPLEAKIRQSLMLKFHAMTEESNETYQGLTYSDFQKSPFRRYASSQLDRLDMNHQHISLHYSLQPIENWSISAQLYRNSTFRDWGRTASAGGVSVFNIIQNHLTHAAAYSLLTGEQNGELVYQNAPRAYLSQGFQMQSKNFFNFNGAKNTFTLGFRLHEDQSDRKATRSIYQINEGVMTLTQSGIPGNAENQIRNASTVSGFLEYEIEIKRLVITAGVRVEDISLTLLNYGTDDFARSGKNLKTAHNHLLVAMPGVGMNYQLSEDQFIFGGVYKGFSPPGTPRPDSIQQAKAETAFNYELGYRVINDKFQLMSALFYNDYQNILGSDAMSTGGMGTGNLYNAGRATTVGLEMSFEAYLNNFIFQTANYQIPLRLAYTYNDSRFRETFQNAGGDWGAGLIEAGFFIPFINPHMVTAAIGLDRWQRWNLTWVSRYASAMRVRPGNEPMIFPDQADQLSQINAIRSTWFFDLSANYQFNSSLTFTGLINNVFNNTAPVSNLPQGVRSGLPFSVLAGLRLTLR